MTADDVILLSESENNLQMMINHVYNWCTKWRMKINIAKSKIMHFRKQNTEQSRFVFLLGHQILDYVMIYKYLGVYIDQFSTFIEHSSTIADAGSRALVRSGDTPQKLKRS